MITSVNTKHRLSASIDLDLAHEAEAAVARGDAPTMSALISAALRLKLDRDRRLGALARFIASEEAGGGPIDEEEIGRAVRAAVGRGVAVRGQRAAEPRARHRAAEARTRR
jgi:Arc/MetJ-type ribon-helix-helix transcriptional regulator